MSTKVGDIFVRATLDDSQYKKGLGIMQKEGNAVASLIGKKMAVALSVAGILKFAKACTEAGASLNAMGTIIDASLPHMTKQVDAFAKSAGQAFGLSETQAKGYVGKFASMAHAMGYTEEQAYKMSTALTGLAGDVASYYHISADEAYGKLGAVFTGETESLKSLGVVMTQNALQSFAMSQGIQKSWYEMSELEKTSLRYQFILQSLSLAQGDFSKYSDTWSGSLAQIRLNWQNFMASVGQGLINILLPLIQVIAKISAVLTWLGNKFLWLTRLITGKDAEVGASIDNTFGSNTQDMMNDTGVSLGNVGSGMKGVGNNAKKAKKDVQALKREMMGFDKITKLTGKADSATGTSGASGIGGGGGGGVGGGVSDLGDLEGLNDLIDGLAIPQETTDSWNGWKKIVGEALDLLLSVGKLVIDDVLSPMIGLVTKHILPTAIDLIGTALKGILETGTNVLNLLIDLFADRNRKVKINVDDKFTPVWNKIKDLKDITLKVGLKKNFGKNNNTVADWVVNSKLLGDLKIYVGLAQSFGTVADWLKNNKYIGTVSALVGLSRSFGTGIKTVYDWITKNSLMGATLNMLVGLGSAFAGGAQTVAEWLTKNKLIGGIATTGGKIVNGIVQFGVNLAQGLGWKGHGVAWWINNTADKKQDGVSRNVGLSKADKWFGHGVGWWINNRADKSQDGVSRDVGLSKSNKWSGHGVGWWINNKADPSQDGVSRDVGLKKKFVGKNGVTYNTVSSWVGSYIGKTITVGVDVVAKSVPKVNGNAKGGVYKNGRWSPIERYASGGMPRGSQLFWARENGAELVGTLGGHTAVMNNDQIVASVSAGVARAIAGIHFKMTAPRLANTAQTQITQAQTPNTVYDPQMITLLTQILKAINAQDNNVYLDGEQIKNSVVRRINNHTRATGQLELII